MVTAAGGGRDKRSASRDAPTAHPECGRSAAAAQKSTSQQQMTRLRSTPAATASACAAGKPPADAVGCVSDVVVVIRPPSSSICSHHHRTIVAEQYEEVAARLESAVRKDLPNPAQAAPDEKEEGIKGCRMGGKGTSENRRSATEMTVATAAAA